MTLESLLKSVSEELEKNGITESIAVNVAFTVNKKTSGEVELECVDGRSRRSEHVHRMKVNVHAPKKSAEPAPDSKPKKSPAPHVAAKREKELSTPPAFPKKLKQW